MRLVVRQCERSNLRFEQRCKRSNVCFERLDPWGTMQRLCGPNVPQFQSESVVVACVANGKMSSVPRHPSLGTRPLVGHDQHVERSNIAVHGLLTATERPTTVTAAMANLGALRGLIARWYIVARTLGPLRHGLA
jgi:hypothetical protein